MLEIRYLHVLYMFFECELSCCARLYLLCVPSLLVLSRCLPSPGSLEGTIWT